MRRLGGIWSHWNCWTNSPTTVDVHLNNEKHVAVVAIVHELVVGFVVVFWLCLNSLNFCKSNRLTNMFPPSLLSEASADLKVSFTRCLQRHKKANSFNTKALGDAEENILTSVLCSVFFLWYIECCCPSRISCKTKH